MLMLLFMIVPAGLVSLSGCLSSENLLFKLKNISKHPAQSCSASNQKLLQCLEDLAMDCIQDIISGGAEVERESSLPA